MRKNQLLIGICLLFIFQETIAQKKFVANPVNRQSATSLRSHFSNYTLFSINTADIADFSQKQKGDKINFELQLPGFTNWKFAITEHDILSKDYTLTVNTPAGKTVLPRPACMTYAGYLTGVTDSRVSLTIDNEIIYGIIKNGEKEYFIEPLWYFNKQAARGVFVIYDIKDVVPDPNLTCGVTESEQRGEGIQRLTAGTNCVQTELAIASDESMFIRYGSASDVQTHNIGVMNNVIWDYVNAQFNDNIEFVIVAQNVSTSAGTDQLTPAYTSTDVDEVLSRFRTWGEGGGFGTGFDLGQFWTTRNLDADGAGGSAGIVGYAYQPALCGTFRYHILEDFNGANPTGSGFGLRVLTSHEIGHNFNCAHDGAGSGFIMAPSVSNTSTWSGASVATVDAYVPGRVCLSACSLAGAPVADFIWSPEAICTGGSFQFIDHSLQGPTSWSWTMTGGTPASSTVRNPTVTYATSGIKSVSLTSTNGVGPSAANSKSILVSSPPVTACTNTGAIASDAGVKLFVLNNMSKSTGGAATDGNKYMDFSCTDITSLSTSTFYTATVNIGDAGSSTFNFITFYIDYNNDGDFADGDELVYSSFPSGLIGTVDFDFTTPASPVTNQFLRTRIIARDFTGAPDAPCFNPSTGQVEDYSVFFPAGILLPVSLLSFDGYHQNGKNILNWKTTDEKDNSYFEVERSVNGTTYEMIGRVNAASSYSSINSYNFTDPLAGTASYDRLFYRLKIVDLYSHAEYSKIVPITIKTNKKELLLTLQPVPFINTITATIQLKSASAINMQLIDMTGRIVYTNEQRLPAGIHTFTYNGFENLPKGSYIIKLASNTDIISRLIEKQ